MLKSLDIHLTKKKSLFNKSQIKKFLKKNIYNDIQDFEALKKVINNNQPEIIFHLASQAIVSESFKNPLRTIYTNIIGTTNLLECLKNNNSVKSVVIVTTDKVYKIKKRESIRKMMKLVELILIVHQKPVRK